MDGAGWRGQSIRVYKPQRVGHIPNIDASDQLMNDGRIDMECVHHPDPVTDRQIDGQILGGGHNRGGATGVLLVGI